jgi:tetratricopeptide (TPR) repeat protein
MHPAAVTPLVHLGDLEQSLKRYDRAQSLYLRALNLEPDHFEANYGLARLQTVTRDSSVAMAQLEKALTLRPNDARVHNDIGQLLAMRGELALAKAKYEHALQLDPQLNAARVNLATVLYQSGETTAAAKLLEQVLQMDRRNYEAFLNAGAMLGTMGEFAKAAELFRAVVSIKPDFPEGYSNLAMALIGQATSEKVETKEKIALLSEAVRMFEKAAELDPAKPDHSQNAAAVARQRDQLRQLEISPG